jgi:hypothetical protein
MTQRDLDALDQPFAPEPFRRPTVGSVLRDWRGLCVVGSLIALAVLA